MNRNADIQIKNTNCMDYMADLEDNAFELAIVDPPYGNNTDADVGTGGYARNWLQNSNGNWDVRPDNKYFLELKRVSKNQIVFGANFFDLPASRGWVCWYKTNEVKGRDFSEFELAYTSFDKPARHFEYVPFIRNGKRIHPTQKPVALYRWLLQKYATEGDKILDTHGGSFSSAIACWEEGFDFVGIELDTDYYQAATKRFNDHISQKKLAFV